ncbi:hypothetical protein GW17_00004664 [Ensete ventricosum]|nr:hypothetical protein GW17_00004664 [Ensete ventricosum]
MKRENSPIWGAYLPHDPVGLSEHYSLGSLIKHPNASKCMSLMPIDNVKYIPYGSNWCVEAIRGALRAEFLYVALPHLFRGGGGGEGDEEEREVKLGKAGELLGIFDCINEVTAAIAAAASSWEGEMSERAYRVETAPRLAQWRIDNISSSCTYRKSDPFKVGLWNWYHHHFLLLQSACESLDLEKNKQLYVKLYPEMSSLTREQPPVASFNIKLVFSSSPNRRTIVHPAVCDKQLKNTDDFVWAIDNSFTGRFIIDIEFLDLKTVSPSVSKQSPCSPRPYMVLITGNFCFVEQQQGGEPSSIWSSHHIEKHSMNTALASFAQMLAEGIHTDITINAAADGSIGAHRAVLAARSPVFRSMFSHDLREKELSTVDISDMSFEACQAFLNYIYGDFQPEEFLRHRVALLGAADKYDVADLKEACHESLLEDIDAVNVLERLHTACLYSLPRLKGGCMRYLVNFGKIYEIWDDFNVFLQTADRELIAEIFHEILVAWRGF